MRTSRILFLSVSAGAGHVRAAQALSAYAQQTPGVEALHLDVMDYVPKTFRKIYVDTYIAMVQKVPSLWGLLYKGIDRVEPERLVQKLRRVVERLNTRKLLKAVADFKPDAVVCTHFLPAEILMHQIIKGEFDKPVWVQATDFDVPRMWMIPQMRGYFAATEEVAFRLRSSDVAPQRVYATGIPVMPAFANPPAREACLKAYGLSNRHPVLLLMGGGAGIGDLNKTAQHLLEQDKHFQLIVLAGKNEQALQALQETAKNYPQRLFPQGFTHKMEELMVCADLVVTKPGGLTTSECLAIGLPMIMYAPIPGQEERNADYLLEQGAAVKAVDELGLIWRVKQLMSSPEHLACMRKRAQAIARPDAGRDVLDVVLQDIA